MNNGNKCRSFQRFTKNFRASERGEEDDPPRCSMRLARGSPSSSLPSPSKTNSYFKAEPSTVYSSTKRDAGSLSEIKVKYAGSLLKAVPEKERGYKARDKGSRSFVIRRRPLSYIIIIDWAWQSLISFEYALSLSLSLSFPSGGGRDKSCPGREEI